MPGLKKLVSGSAITVLVVGLVSAVAAPAYAALPAGPAAVGVTGERPSATRVPFPISDQAQASVDVATGNLLVRSSSLSLVGVNGAVPITQAYNSLASATGTIPLSAGNRWTTGIGGAGYLSQGTGAVIYTTPDGATWSFLPVAGSATAFTSPAGFKQDLVASASGYTLTDRASRTVVVFNLDGKPTSVADRNGNGTVVTYTSSTYATVVSTAGPVVARTAVINYNSSLSSFGAAQTSGPSSRQILYKRNIAADLTTITDPEGKVTSFTYSGGRMASITSPSGAVTSFTYDGAGKVTQVSQTNTSAGSPGTSITRLAYPSATQTLLARPNTDQAQPVASVPRVTYTIDAAVRLAIKAVDEMGRERAATYTANSDAATQTAGTGATAGTTTGTYAANSGDSMTKLERPGGSSSNTAYGNTAAATKYLPTSTTSDAGNTSTYSYNGAGNQLTSTNALAAEATLTYNTDGTVATALAPGNGTNKTVYSYNVNKQLQTVTPVTGSSLGVRTFTYDDFGRVRTETTGRGVTVTYSYDKLDRVLTTAFSGGTATVTNTYTALGQIATRVDANGTTTFGYDQLGRLASRVNTFAGGTITYGYDKASNLTTVTDGRGTSTNAFDASGTPLGITYTVGANTQVLGFATDNRGRRTDTWLQTNSARTVWKAHTRQVYDTSDRVTRVVGKTRTTAGVETTVMDVSYCYSTYTPAPTCTNTTNTDRAKLQWSVDNLTGQTTTYSYDTAGHVTNVAQAGGTGANTYTYTYDARGNRLTATVTGATPSSQTFTANAANQISTAGYTFDGSGNLTADPAGSYTYNGAEQMTTVTQGTAVHDYKYAGTNQNEVLQQEQNGATVKLVYGRTNPQGVPVVEQAQVGNGTAYIENDPVTGQPLMLRTSNGVQTLYVYNGTGTPVAMLTDTAYVAYSYAFDPYGVDTLTATSGGSGANQNPFMFSGGIQDRATGWVKFGVRWYSPTIGRWTQQDTLDAPLDPANANRYAYAGCDPVNNQDLTGRLTTSQFLCVVGAVTAVGAVRGVVAQAGITYAALVSGTVTGGAGFVLAIGGGLQTAISAGVVALEIALTAQACKAAFS